jgi:hypothetical protein
MSDSFGSVGGSDDPKELIGDTKHAMPAIIISQQASSSSSSSPSKRKGRRTSTTQSKPSSSIEILHDPEELVKELQDALESDYDDIAPLSSSSFKSRSGAPSASKRGKTVAHAEAVSDLSLLAPLPREIYFKAKGWKYEMDASTISRDPIPPPSFSHNSPDNTNMQELLGQYYCYTGFFSYPFKDGIERLVSYPTCTLGEKCPWVKRWLQPRALPYQWCHEAREVLADRHEFLGERAAAIDEYFTRVSQRKDAILQARN